MRSRKRSWRWLALGILLAALVAVLIFNLVIVVDLPSRVYTAEQRAYLDYNRGRSISQLAPSLNVVSSEGTSLPMTLSFIRENRVRATLYARYEEQGGVSVTVYDLEFQGDYKLVYDGPLTAIIEIFFPFPANLETLHQVRLLDGGEEPADVQYTTAGISWPATLRPGEEHQIEISYHADGANSFAYRLDHGVRTDVDVAVTVAGLAGSTVPRTSLPTTTSVASDDGEVLTWDYAGLIVDRDVQLNLPRQLSFAQRIAELEGDFQRLAGLAPFLVILFLGSLAAVFRFGQIRVGLETYLLAGCAMALFYPLLIFLSGLADLVPAAILSLLLVSGLLLVFLGLSAGWKMIRWRVSLLLAVFLGFFSLGVLTPWQGLMLTAGGLLLVGTLMLLYARRPPDPEPEPLPPLPDEEEPQPEAMPGEPNPEPELHHQSAEELDGAGADMATHESFQVPAGLYCPLCARALDDDYRFCPACGYDTQRLTRCAACEVRQYVPAEVSPAYCVHCGESLDASAHRAGS